MTLDNFIEMIWGLFPPGKAWVREDGVLNDLISGLAAELAKIDGRKETLILEADPRTTMEMLEDFESDYGLPDECTPLAATIKERRDALVNKIIADGDMRPVFYQALIKKLGYDVDDLIEWQPLTTGGELTTGTMTVSDETSRFCWGWTMYGFASHMFECGVSQCYDPLGDWSDTGEIICRINKLKPSHTQVVFNFEEARA